MFNIKPFVMSRNKKEKLQKIQKNCEKEPFNFRTDLATERRDLYRKANSIENEIDGIESEKEMIEKTKKTYYQQNKNVKNL